MSNIRTPWFDKVDRRLPLAEYPRPQFERKDWICLNGEYDYAVTGDTADTPKKYDGKILVPFSVESELSGVGKALLPEQRLWYRRKFTVGKEFSGKEALLHFGAVDWQCSVWVNGKLVGEHTGGYNPFTFNITDVIVEGENELVVKVFDPTDAGHQQRGKQILVTKGFWYTATSGIWQTVWLEPVNRCRIDSLRLVPDIDEGVIRINIKRTCKCGGKLYAKVLEGDKVVFDGEIADKAAIPVPDARLWSPEAPFLYTLLLTLDCNGEKDEVSSYFGMRKFSIVKDSAGIPRLGLNNKPYFQRGLLDQGYWPEGLYTPPSDAAVVHELQTIKELGFNLLRKHAKIEPQRWYYHCDKLGLIVWQDMVNGGGPYKLWFVTYLTNVLQPLLRKLPDTAALRGLLSRRSEASREEYGRELEATVEVLRGHPCIGCWVPFNEGWGQFDAAQAVETLRALDPDRLVDEASGWYDQGGGDVDSRHNYFYPLHLRPGRRTVALSEYGGIAWPMPGHEPPRRTYGYGTAKSRAELTGRYRKLQLETVLPQLRNGLSALVYTQVSDVEDEVNGLFTYDRQAIKPDPAAVRAVNEALEAEFEKVLKQA